MQRFQNLSSIDIAGICALFAGFCGALSYGLKVEEGHKFTWREFVLHTLTSAVFGLMTYEILSYYGMPSQVSGALCGMAGWMGTRGARIAEIVIRKRAGVTKEDLEGGKDSAKQEEKK